MKIEDMLENAVYQVCTPQSVSEAEMLSQFLCPGTETLNKYAVRLPNNNLLVIPYTQLFTVGMRIYHN